MSWITEILSIISTALLYPVVVLLVTFFGFMLVHLGSFVREWLHRRRTAGSWERAQRTLSARAILDGDGEARFPSTVRAFLGFVREAGEDPEAAARVERYLDGLEMELERTVERTSLLSKVGPMLGLAGTLIPLGPALQGMSSGDVAALARNLMVAFSATVVGLSIAGPCYWISSVRKRWYAHDVRQLELFYRSLAGAPSPEESDAEAASPVAP